MYICYVYVYIRASVQTSYPMNCITLITVCCHILSVMYFFCILSSCTSHAPLHALRFSCVCACMSLHLQKGVCLERGREVGLKLDDISQIHQPGFIHFPLKVHESIATLFSSWQVIALERTIGFSCDFPGFFYGRGNLTGIWKKYWSIHSGLNEHDK